MIIYSAMLVLSLWLNRADFKMLLLSALVSGSFFFQVPRESALAYYPTCIAVEIFVAFCAYKLKAKASTNVVDLCGVMILAHIMGWIINDRSSLEPYTAIMFLTEYAQIVTCAWCAVKSPKILWSRKI